MLTEARKMLETTHSQLGDYLHATKNNQLHVLPFTVGELITRLKVSAELVGNFQILTDTTNKEKRK